MKLAAALVMFCATLPACYFDAAPSDEPGVAPDSEVLRDYPPFVALPPDARLCPDETGNIESDTDINTGSSSLVTSSPKRTWIAWKYAPEFSHELLKLCLYAQAISEPTAIYLIDDSGNAPGAPLKEGDLYNTSQGMLCTLDAPFNFTAAVVAGHTYWIASNAGSLTLANDGARIPYFVGDGDPGAASGANWSPGCSAGIVASIGVKR